MQFIAAPIGLAMAALVGYCWHRVGIPTTLHMEGSGAIVLLVCLPLFFTALIVVHELLHAAVHPRFGRSKATIIGVWLRRRFFYAHYSGPLTRDRFLVVFAMPFLIITILPLAVAAIGLLPPALLMAASWFSTCNALFASGDFVGFALILAQVPRASIVQNKSWRTYWKPL